MEKIRMSKLSAAERKKIPGKEFAGPGRSFPIEDRTHAEAAIRDAPHALHAGSITAEEEETIVRRARDKLGKRHPSTREAVRRATAKVTGE